MGYEALLLFVEGGKIIAGVTLGGLELVLFWVVFVGIVGWDTLVCMGWDTLVCIGWAVVFAGGTKVELVVLFGVVVLGEVMSFEVVFY